MSEIKNLKELVQRLEVLAHNLEKMDHYVHKHAPDVRDAIDALVSILADAECLGKPGTDVSHRLSEANARIDDHDRQKLAVEEERDALKTKCEASESAVQYYADDTGEGWTLPRKGYQGI